MIQVIDNFLNSEEQKYWLDYCDDINHVWNYYPHTTSERKDNPQFVHSVNDINALNMFAYKLNSNIHITRAKINYQYRCDNKENCLHQDSPYE